MELSRRAENNGAWPNWQKQSNDDDKSNHKTNTEALTNPRQAKTTLRRTATKAASTTKKRNAASAA